MLPLAECVLCDARKYINYGGMGNSKNFEEIHTKLGYGILENSTCAGCWDFIFNILSTWTQMRCLFAQYDIRECININKVQIV